jgi:hypothetical protein
MLTNFLDYQRAIPIYQPAELLSRIEELQADMIFDEMNLRNGERETE